MSTDLQDPETAEWSPTIPMADSNEVGVPEAEMDAAVEGDPEPGDAETEVIATEAEPTEDASDDSAAMKLALADLYSIQDRLDEAGSDFETKNERAKTAKKRVEALQDDLQAAVRRLREVKRDAQPDPVRYPLLDKPDPAKAAINAEFPAETVEQFYIRKRSAVRIDSLGLKKKTVKALTKLGIQTMEDWATKQSEQVKFNGDMIGLGITPLAFEEIIEAFEPLTIEWLKEWNEAHPETTKELDSE
jgi:hypothetical protein